MAFLPWVKDNSGWMAHVVKDGEDASHGVRGPADNKDCVECPRADIMEIAKGIPNVDGRGHALKIDDSPNSQTANKENLDYRNLFRKQDVPKESTSEK